MLGGSSPQTGYIGSLGIAASLFDIISGHISAVMADTGTPTNRMEWIILVMSIGLRLAKDANKTNSQHPTAIPITAPVVDAPK